LVLEELETLLGVILRLIVSPLLVVEMVGQPLAMLLVVAVQAVVVEDIVV
jgi:hypothetical protein